MLIKAEWITVWPQSDNEKSDPFNIYLYFLSWGNSGGSRHDVIFIQWLFFLFNAVIAWCQQHRHCLMSATPSLLWCQLMVKFCSLSPVHRSRLKYPPTFVAVAVRHFPLTGLYRRDAPFYNAYNLQLEPVHNQNRNFTYSWISNF